MTIKPTNYNLTFEPDLEKFTFKGKEILTFEVKDHAREIILDAVDLDVRSVILAKGARLPLGASAKWGPESWLDSEVIRKNSPQNDKRVSFRFEQTPLMSTYLLYLGVGEFEWIEDKFKDVLLRVITTPGKKHYGKFALECAKKSLEYFEKYFNYHYPLKKLDLIAITEFASGAMENWGAITFRENSLLYYPEKSSKATKQRIAEVIAHEIAHQWFGNLVTMKWWDDIWLNESFATYMAHKVLNNYWPEWNVWSQYVTDTVFEGMALDSLKSSNPIKVKVNKISEIDELFDEIAYEKGGSILRMLDLYLGEEVFMNGL